ncbi:3677_t:CDS:2 [Gigaspora rosea]|nr:3677_t:CDS:2 [Gigaspora rosea]
MATDFQVERLKSSMDPPVTTLQLLDQTLLQEDPYPRVNSSDLTYLEWLRAFVDYDEIEGPRQEDGHMVEACQLEDPYDDKVDWEEYYWEELENLYHDPDTGIMWTLCDTSPEVMNLEEIYMVNDHWEIEAEERFLTATTDHITNGNGWYEEEDFKVYLAITPDETDFHETKDQGHTTEDPYSTKDSLEGWSIRT